MRTKRDYFSYSLKEYILLGRSDAINGYGKCVKSIIRTLKNMEEDYIIDRVKNYLIGFELGTIEVYLKDMRLYPNFDFDNCTLTFDRDILPNDEQRKSALEETHQLLRRFGKK